ncbi:hypothetical protein SAMN05216474_0552 [Lishizhenia tianjinensis]|uniref:Uncharacterized protein n=1 Tax=Lishizhenia tianjinensis TaxID=477690 RepID=A0A1I6XZ02_9FLAO|nr:putative DNA-binding domain-containing protein [Lishizhenia tianjinensis]SFT43550.1 hypothetical protein SAMN05216474_0552 [Lishizhenia tianjinensis]
MLKKETQHIQEDLALYCRTNVQQDLPNVREDRLHHYRRLIFTIVNDALKGNYPIAYKQFSSKAWEEIVTEFLAEHAFQNNQLFKMPGEFIAFAEEKNYAEKYAIPYLIDLLKFEWVEVEVHTMADEDIPEVQQDSDLITDTLYFSPYLKLLTLNYPIHLLKRQEKLEEKATYLLIYRQENGTVQYMELAPLMFNIVENLIGSGQSVSTLLEEELNQLPEVQKQEILQGISASLMDLLHKGIILGTK